jgi:hypothetical protein
LNLRRRLAALESALAARAPHVPRHVHQCHGSEVSAADRRAAVDAAGARGITLDRILFVTVVDARRADRTVSTPEEIETTPTTLSDAQRAVLDAEIAAGRITARQVERLHAAIADGATLHGAVEHALGTTAQLDIRVAYLTEKLTHADGASSALSN